MSLLPSSNGENFVCPTTRQQLQKCLFVANSTRRAPPRSLNQEDPSNARFIRRQRKLRTTKRGSSSTTSNSNKLHAVDDSIRTRLKRIVSTASTQLTIQPSSNEDAEFLVQLAADSETCLKYPEWFEKYAAEMVDRFVDNKELRRGRASRGGFDFEQDVATLSSRSINATHSERCPSESLARSKFSFIIGSSDDLPTHETCLVF